MLLIVGNKNYSSWSFRPWIGLRAAGIAFDEEVIPLYDAGNFGMQRRRVHGVMSSATFNPRAVMDDLPQDYTKAMEITDTIPGPIELVGAGNGSPVG